MIAALAGLFLSAALAAPGDLRAELDALEGASDAALQAQAAGPWREALLAQAGLAERHHTGLTVLAANLTPVRTRKGTPRFVDEALTEPGLAPLLLVRLVEAGDPADVRVALVDAARRAQADPALVAGLIGVEEDPAVRRMLVEVLSGAPTAVAGPALVRASTDPSPEVRAGAARAIGAHPDGASLGAPLLALLTDPEAAVRTEACRASGWLGIAEAWALLTARVADPDPTVRLRAIRALQRIDPAGAAQHPAVMGAVGDPDAKVARAARQVTAG
jgi:hypothetical protein